MCSPWWEFTSQPDKIMCVICFEWKTVNELFPDPVDGQLWDVCMACGTKAGQSITCLCGETFVDELAFRRHIKTIMLDDDDRNHGRSNQEGV